MSHKRLGSNPLSWVAPEGAATTPDVPVTDAPSSGAIPAATQAAPHTLGGGYFTPSDMFTKEDLMGKNKIKIKKSMETAEAIGHLEDLAASMKNGVIRAEDGKETVVLATGETVYFEMKLSRKKDKAKCSIEMEWADDGTKLESFKISGE